jgi:hypothetical protein
MGGRRRGRLIRAKQPCRADSMVIASMLAML